MIFDSEINRAFRRMSESFFDMDDIFEDARGNPGTKPHWYGYAVSVGPNGIPVIKEYGHVPKGASSLDSAKEPIVDTIVDEKSNTVKLIAEIPGVEKSDIQIVVDDKVVDISAARDNKKYHAKVPVRHNVDEKSAKASYKNGILQLVFKQVATTPSGTKVEVN